MLELIKAGAEIGKKIETENSSSMLFDKMMSKLSKYCWILASISRYRTRMGNEHYALHSQPG